MMTNYQYSKTRRYIVNVKIPKYKGSNRIFYMADRNLPILVTAKASAA